MYHYKLSFILSTSKYLLKCIYYRWENRTFRKEVTELGQHPSASSKNLGPSQSQSLEQKASRLRII